MAKLLKFSFHAELRFAPCTAVMDAIKYYCPFFKIRIVKLEQFGTIGTLVRYVEVVLFGSFFFIFTFRLFIH